MSLIKTIPFLKKIPIKKIFFLFVLTTIGFYPGCLIPSVIEHGIPVVQGKDYLFLWIKKSRGEGGCKFSNTAAMLEILNGFCSSACFVYKQTYISDNLF